MVEVFLARQPIFDRQRQVYGYELLFRSGGIHNGFDGTEASSATMQVMANALLAADLNVLRGKKAFLNFNHDLLRDGLHLAMPPESIVIELLETVEPTEELVARCRDLRRQGYTIALDDFVPDPKFEPLTRIAQLIKVDFRTTGKQEQECLLRKYGSRGVIMLAEKVETYEEFEWARNAGYDLFQGYFFAHPMLVRGRQIPAGKIACLRLLREVAQSDMDFDRLEALIGEDVALSYKLLRYANSPFFGRRTKTHSIPTALVILGEGNLRHWAALAALPMMAQDKPGELVTLALTRAKFCESLIQLAESPLREEAFLMGMFSLLGALIDKPLDEALHEVNVDPRITTALLGTSQEDDILSRVHRLNQRYEAGEWDQADGLAAACRIPSLAVGHAYVEAAKWADCAMHGFA